MILYSLAVCFSFIGSFVLKNSSGVFRRSPVVFFGLFVAYMVERVCVTEGISLVQAMLLAYFSLFLAVAFDFDSGEASRRIRCLHVLIPAIAVCESLIVTTLISIAMMRSSMK